MDPANLTLTAYVRNIGLTKFMATVEKQTYTPDCQDMDKTVVKKEVNLTLGQIKNQIKPYDFLPCFYYRPGSTAAFMGFGRQLESLGSTDTRKTRS